MAQRSDDQTTDQDTDFNRLRKANNELIRYSQIPILFLNLLYGYTILEIWIIILAAFACISTEFCVFKELEEATSTKNVIMASFFQATLPIIKIPFLHFTFKYIRERELLGLQILATIAFGTLLFSYFQTQEPSAVPKGTYIFGLGHPISILIFYGKLKRLRILERKLNISEPVVEE